MKGFLWYQGEKNSAIPMHRDLYQCTFPAMIKQWRREFSAHSSTKPNAPWGFVQLGKYDIKSKEYVLTATLSGLGWPFHLLKTEKAELNLNMSRLEQIRKK